MHKGIKSGNVRRHAFLVYDSGIALFTLYLKKTISCMIANYKILHKGPNDIKINEGRKLQGRT